MANGYHRYPAFKFMVTCDVEHIGSEHIKRYAAAISVSRSPTVAVGLKVLFVSIQGSAPALHAVSVGLDCHQRDRLCHSVFAKQEEVLFVEEFVIYDFPFVGRVIVFGGKCGYRT